jgi:hypothetical protein
MAETLEKHARVAPPQCSRAVVDRLIRSYWTGALHWSDVKWIMHTAEVESSRLEFAVKDEEAGEP